MKKKTKNKNDVTGYVKKKENLFELDGVVVEMLPNANFKVELTNNNIINAHLSGKMRKNYIKISKGDKVTVQFSTYDTKKGRIIFRNDKS